MKGFNGSALWALLALLVVGVAWVQSNTDFTTAAYALMAVGAVVLVVVGFLLALAAKQITLNGIIEFKKSEAGIERERERSRREDAKHEHRLEARTWQMGTMLARQLFSAWRVQSQAEERASSQVDDEFVSIDPSSYQFVEDEEGS